MRRVYHHKEILDEGFWTNREVPETRDAQARK